MRPFQTAVLAAASLAAPAAAFDLELVLVNEADISHLELGRAGGMAHDPALGGLWIADGCGLGLCDGAGTDAVFLVDPWTGAERTRIDARPLGTVGPDALARRPRLGWLYLWGLGEAWAVDATGAPQLSIAGGPYSAATFTPTGEIWAGEIFGEELYLVDPATGVVLAMPQVVGLNDGVDSLTHDPRTGRLVGLHHGSGVLYEVSLYTFEVIAWIPLPAAVLQTGEVGAIEFDEDGTHLFYAEPSWTADAQAPINHVLYTFERLLPGEPLCFGDGSGAACPCANEGASGAGCTHSGGLGARMFDAGSDSASADDLHLMGIDLTPGQPALLFAGTTLAGGGAGVAFGDGLRCADGAVRRLRTVVSDTAGRAPFSAGLGALGGWGAGDTRFFQAYYRDPAGSPCGSGFNTTHAVRVTFGA